MTRWASITGTDTEMLWRGWDTNENQARGTACGIAFGLGASVDAERAGQIATQGRECVPIPLARQAQESVQAIHTDTKGA
jgi:hypothetical protein